MSGIQSAQETSPSTGTSPRPGCTCWLNGANLSSEVREMGREILLISGQDVLWRSIPTL